MLRKLRASGGHRFWPERHLACDESVFDPAYIRGTNRVTDVYLLGLAVSAGGALATFDRSRFTWPRSRARREPTFR